MVRDLNRKIFTIGAIFSICNFVALVVVIEMAIVWKLLHFSIFRRNFRFPQKKIYSLAQSFSI